MFIMQFQQTKPNKNVMVGILLAEKALLKSPYVKRYMPLAMDSIGNK